MGLANNTRRPFKNRSVPSLVGALNALFSPAFSAHWLSLPKWEKELPYLPVKAGRREESLLLDQKASLHFFIGKNLKKKSFYPAENLFFSYMGQEIERLHGEGAVPYREMAILVKDRYQMERLKTYFLEKKIPFNSKNRKS